MRAAYGGPFINRKLFQRGHKGRNMGTENNKGSENTAKWPKLGELMYEAYLEDGHSLASFTYDYIDKNLYNYISSRSKRETKITYAAGSSDEHVNQLFSYARIGEIKELTKQFIAELHEAMADYIIKNGSQDASIRWPSSVIQIDTFYSESNKKESDAYVNDQLKNHYYLDLLDTTCNIPNRPTPLENRVSNKEAEIASLTPKKKHPVRHLLGWLLTFLLFLNTAAAVMFQFFGKDLGAILQDFCYHGLVRLNLRTFADILDSLLNNLMITGDLMSGFGQNTQGSLITFGVTALLFILALYCMIQSKRKYKANEAARVARIDTLKKEIGEIRSSVEFYEEVLHRQAVANYYPEMMKAFRKASGR